MENEKDTGGATRRDAHVPEEIPRLSIAHVMGAHEALQRENEYWEAQARKRATCVALTAACAVFDGRAHVRAAHVDMLALGTYLPQLAHARDIAREADELVTRHARDPGLLELMAGDRHGRLDALVKFFLRAQGYDPTHLRLNDITSHTRWRRVRLLMDTVETILAFSALAGIAVFVIYIAVRAVVLLLDGRAP